MKFETVAIGFNISIFMIGKHTVGDEGCQFINYMDRRIHTGK